MAPCNDGEDNDSDGWTDESDPDCVLAEEEDPDAFYLKKENGYSDTECNDGEDNDEDGFTDADDPECISSDIDKEASTCVDGEDNDEDGWVDDDDPDCFPETGIGIENGIGQVSVMMALITMATTLSTK